MKIAGKRSQMAPHPLQGSVPERDTERARQEDVVCRRVVEDKRDEGWRRQTLIL